MHMLRLMRMVVEVHKNFDNFLLLFHNRYIAKWCRFNKNKCQKFLYRCMNCRFVTHFPLFGNLDVSCICMREAQWNIPFFFILQDVPWVFLYFFMANFGEYGKHKIQVYVWVCICKYVYVHLYVVFMCMHVKFTYHDNKSHMSNASKDLLSLGMYPIDFVGVCLFGKVCMGSMCCAVREGGRNP
mgnify:CR=1 FL=1